MDVLQIEHRDEWAKVLEQVFAHDFYHTHAYHAVAERRGEGKACFFVHREGKHTVALPLLLRRVNQVAGFETAGADWWDATSVYGYSGPLASQPEMPGAVLHNFQEGLRASLRERHVISVFSRLHPLIPQGGLLSGMGECLSFGKTISIDVTAPLEEQRKQIRTNHARDIKKLKKLGMVCFEDSRKEYLPEFVDIYTETMKRVDAGSYYFFDRAYFETLLDCFGANAYLFFVRFEGELACGGFFVVCDGILQYHLGGTRADFLKLAPMKLLVDEVRLWATRQGFKAMHLGGGVNGREDCLFKFKAGFSDVRHEFSTWRWAPDPELYKTACAWKTKLDICNRAHPASLDFFPQYRCPSLPQEEPSSISQ